MKEKELKRMLGLVGNCSYNEVNKQEFRRLSTKFLKELRSELGIPDAEVRFNPGGIAVSGDATLHGEHVYVTFNADNSMLGVLYRTCKGKKDYTGGENRWYSYGSLRENGLDGLATAICGLVNN